MLVGWLVGCLSFKKMLSHVQPDLFGLAYNCGASFFFHNLVALLIGDIFHYVRLLTCAGFDRGGKGFAFAEI